MDAKTRSKVTSSTQDHLAIRDIIDDLIITKTNSVALVIQTNAVNFALLSEQEQINKISGFAGLLNSLSFPIQILITTRRIDITKYLEFLKNQENNTMTKELKEQLAIYQRFVKNLIVQNDVLDKNFYIVISHYGSGNVTNPIQIAKAQNTGVMYNKRNLIEKGKAQLYFKRDHILKQIRRMGLTGTQLETSKLIDLFYDLYNTEK